MNAADAAIVVALRHATGVRIVRYRLRKSGGTVPFELPDDETCTEQGAVELSLEAA